MNTRRECVGAAAAGLTTAFIENVIIRNCEMKDGHGGVTVGSMVSGGVRKVFAESCQLNSPNLNQALRFKSNAMCGGTIENILFRNIDIRDVTCKRAKYVLNLQGFKAATVRDIRLERCTFDNVSKQDVIREVQGLILNDVKVNGKIVKRG